MFVTHGEEKTKKRGMIIALLCVALVCVIISLVMIYWNRASGETAIFNAANAGFGMGSQTTCKVYGPSEETCREQAEAMQKEIETLEAHISRRIDDSQTAAIVNATGDFVEAPEVVGILDVMLPLCELSGGRLDPTIAPVTELWDIDGLNPRLPEKQEILDRLKSVDYRWKELGSP